MPRKSGSSDRKSTRIAMGGVFSALAVVVMLGGGILPLATFSAPIFAGLLLIPVREELGAKTALIAYIAVSVLSFLITPDREMTLFFIFLFGYYPILYPKLQAIKNPALRWGAKFLLFNAAVVAAYALFFAVFAGPALRQEFFSEARWMHVLLLVLGNATFILYDVLVDKIKIVYVWKLRKKFFR